jgi:hypothetical protein
VDNGALDEECSSRRTDRVVRLTACVAHAVGSSRRNDRLSHGP